MKTRDRIMPKKHAAQDILVAVQREIFRYAKRDYGLSAKRISVATQIPETTIKSWADGAAMPAWAFAVITQIVPDHLTTLMFEQFDKFVGTDEPDDGGLDDLAEETAGFTDEYVRATSPKSPGGPNIVPIERAKLKERAKRVASKARRAAA